jgi:hypothetical protein
MPSHNYVERNHTEIGFEFGGGLIEKGGFSISLNRDNQTREVSFTGCLSGGVTFGEVKGVFKYNENATGGITDSVQLSGSVTLNEVIGLGPGYKASYNLFNTNLEATQSVPNESVYSVFGGGVDISGEGCLEINPKGVLQELREIRNLFLDKLLGSDKDSVFDKDSLVASEKLGANGASNSLRDAKDASHGDQKSGFGGLGDGRSLGEKPDKGRY